MWIGMRVWRSFPELRGHSDGECRRLVGSACVRFEVSPFPAWVAGALGVLAGASLVAAVGDPSADADRVANGASIEAAIVLFAWSAFPLAVSVVFAGAVRAFQARRALRRLLQVASCRDCGYMLHGLSLADPPGLDPNPAERRLRCPECGKRWTLAQLGLLPIDLLPWDRRIPAPEVGRMRRPAIRVMGRAADLRAGQSPSA